MTTTVCIIRLHSGETLIANVRNYSTSSFKADIIAEDANIIGLTNDQQVGFAPFAPFVATKNIPIAKEDYLFCQPAEDKLTQHFQKMTSKIIQPAASKLIV